MASDGRTGCIVNAFGHGNQAAAKTLVDGLHIGQNFSNTKVSPPCPSTRWLSPRAALAQYWQGQIELTPPQIMSLVQLARHTQVQSVLQAARQRPPPVIAPEPFDDDGTRVICYPGDERHSVREQYLLGPTRLVYRLRLEESILQIHHAN